MNKRLSSLALGFLLTVGLCGCQTTTAEHPKITVSDSSAALVETPQSAFASGTSAESFAAADTAVSATETYAEKLFNGGVLDIYITTEAEDWQYLMENAGSKPWITADITINGTTFEKVGIKTKGNTSLQQLVKEESTRYSLKVSFGKYEDGQTCYGLDKLALNNIYADSTYLKEYMSYDLLRYMNVPCSLCTFANITVNGEPYGLFLAVEDADDSYLDRLYGTDSTVKAYKPEAMDMNDQQGGDFPQMPDNMSRPEMPDGQNFPQMPDDMSRLEMPDGQNFPEMPDGQNFSQMPDDMSRPEMPDGQNFPQQPGNGKGFGMDGGRNGVDLTYSDDNADSYSNIFDNNINKVEDEDKQRLIASLKQLNSGENIESVVNVDEVLRYTACNVFLVNLDSYLSSNCHNYILTESNGQLSILPWDYNLSFGTYQMKQASEAVNYAIDTVFNDVSADERPLIGKLLENEAYREKYHEYLRQIAEQYIGSGTFEKTVEEVTSLIDSYVKNDTTSFDGYDAFVEGVSALKLFLSLRTESVLGQLYGRIPATQETQQNSDQLVDASALSLEALGGMNMNDGQQRDRFPNEKPSAVPDSTA